ncbi:MAG: Do family serine endopeptidase [Candidatus Omnitrophica bacterium]|nr:Do family serine endopeptidase [Candidatus Omnitrophota bacterium]
MKAKPVVIWITCVLVVLAAAFQVQAALFQPPGTAEPGALPTFADVAEKVYPSVVSIISVHVQRMRALGIPQGPHGDEFFDQFFREFFGDVPDREFRYTGLGSGVIIDEQGFILTNYHVVEGADEVTVRLPDGREFKGEIRGTDRRSDLAVVKVNASKLPVAPLGNSDKIRIGDWAIAIGNPFGFLNDPQPSMTVGVVSALNRALPQYQEGDRYYGNLIQTDAAINRGNSGGPLVNAKGEVVGINTAIFATPGGGYIGAGFAIPINRAKEVLSELVAGKQVLYGWLGVNVQDIDQNFAEYFKLADTDGVLVARVHPASPAEQGGLREGDIIRFYDGDKVVDTTGLIQRVGRTTPGRTVSVVVIREGQNLPLQILIEPRPSQQAAVEQEPETAVTPWRGITVAPLTEELVKELDITDTEGVFVAQVEPKSPAGAAGLEHGDVITQVNRQSVASVEGFAKLTSQLKGDVLLRTLRGYILIKEAQ